LSSPVTKSF
nr:Chain C, LSSPVTKSF [synthetic construct]3VH8_C Chain C, peptide of Ig kappa chain C region [Homo sapiens]3VH8_F Chain F, peptide of Ig kappa chain C region [Homo sapiens]3WUW_C Chain C, Peptide [Homo sapiens]3X11_C Chain C, Ig kappa chain C region [Homo sapiens]3X12_C Chain C, Ig kappa chain C region [Homo sapiens]5B38_C Chain C, peptide from Ig kappa chain C region [Homo sapiens]5B39_C Chain C, peptide from Ig kappa chain C region [Homo sapiens]6V2Q_C Chain C, Peptide LEU-SER-SER-PRO-VA